MRRGTTMRPLRRSSTSRSREGGQVLVIFVGGLVTLILFVGLVIDGGYAFLNRRDAQNIADTGALAGTKVVADNYTKSTRFATDVWAAIDSNVVTANGCSPTGDPPCTWSAQFIDRDENRLGDVTNTPSGLPFGTQGVVVTVSRQPHTFFLGVIGQTSWNVGAAATAATARIEQGPPAQLLPIGTNPPQPFNPGQNYVLANVGTTSGSSPSFGPGNFGWLSWTGDPSATTLANSLCYPDNPSFTMPFDFPGAPGATNGSNVRACLDQYIQDGTTVLIPVVSGCNPCNGNNAVFTVTGVAAFVLTGYTQSGGAINSLAGDFVRYYDAPSVPAGLGHAPQPGDSAYFLGLIR